MDKISQQKREYREQQWMELIRGRQHSGQTVKAYCEINGVKVKTYYYWLRKLRMKLCEQAVVALPRLTEQLPCPPSNGTITVRCGAITVEISEGMSEVTIRAVMGALVGGC